MPSKPSAGARSGAAACATSGSRGRALNGNKKWAQTDRVLDGERTRGNDSPAARCIAAVGRDYRRICRCEPPSGRGHTEAACAAGPRSGADERRHRVAEEPGEEGTDLAGRWWRLLYAGGDSKHSELRKLSYADRVGVRVRRYRH